MTTYQEKAEAFVRSQIKELMELSFGCEVDTGVPRTILENRGDTIITLAGGIRFSNKLADLEASKHWKIIGHPIQLQHWLKAIPTYIPYFIETVEASDITTIRLSRRDGQDKPVWFNLTTGQPASEKDYQMFCTLVGVE